MSARFEELAYQPTAMGDISLRRRRDPVTGEDVYEVKLDDDYLMSSLFTVAEIELSRLALAELPGLALDVVVGGLGLGYTAHTVLAAPHVASLVVVEALGEVIGWHRDGLLPLGRELIGDPRCRLVQGDFIAAALAGTLDPDAPGRQFDAIVVDIDHSPRNVLHPSHASFYEPSAAHRLAAQLHPGGVFALWSDDPPDAEYEAVLAEAFPDVRAEVVRFPGASSGLESANTVYVATNARA
ncbi:MAG: spermidine synthase [Frankiales bacterium]|nr:spermidine synthase [Frankiales bacterium]